MAKKAGWVLSLGDAVAPVVFKTRKAASDAALAETVKRGGLKAFRVDDEGEPYVRPQTIRHDSSNAVSIAPLPAMAVRVGPLP